MFNFLQCWIVRFITQFCFSGLLCYTRLLSILFFENFQVQKFYSWVIRIMCATGSFKLTKLDKISPPMLNELKRLKCIVLLWSNWQIEKIESYEIVRITASIWLIFKAQKSWKYFQLIFTPFSSNENWMSPSLFLSKIIWKNVLSFTAAVIAIFDRLANLKSYILLWYQLKYCHTALNNRATFSLLLNKKREFLQGFHIKTKRWPH